MQSRDAAGVSVALLLKRNQRPKGGKIPADLSHPAESGPLRVVAIGPAAACHFHLAAGGEPAMTTYLPSALRPVGGPSVSMRDEEHSRRAPSRYRRCLDAALRGR